MKHGRLSVIISLALVLVLGVALMASCASAPPDDIPDWQHQFDLGMRFLSQGNYQEAIIAFRAAIEISPRADAFLGLADAYVGMGDVASAIAALREGYELTGDERLRLRMEALENELHGVPASYNLPAEQIAFLERMIDACLARDAEFLFEAQTSALFREIVEANFEEDEHYHNYGAMSFVYENSNGQLSLSVRDLTDSNTLAWLFINFSSHIGGHYLRSSTVSVHVDGTEHEYFLADFALGTEDGPFRHVRIGEWQDRHRNSRNVSEGTAVDGLIHGELTNEWDARHVYGGDPIIEEIITTTYTLTFNMGRVIPIPYVPYERQHHNPPFRSVLIRGHIFTIRDGDIVVGLSSEGNHIISTRAESMDTVVRASSGRWWSHTRSGGHPVIG